MAARTTKAVILAGGLGTRMRRADATATLTSEQASAADDGVKGMISVGRPFMDYIVSALADAGITDVCLVIGPEHQRVRDYYSHTAPPARVRMHFAVQDKPLGTADAVLAAESFAAGDNVLMVNSDNYYPVHTLAALGALGAAGVAGFTRDALVRLGNIDADRVAKFSVIRADASGYLTDIIEKPDATVLRDLGDKALVGMNSWSLPPEIYTACRSISVSPRGELELQDAVMFAAKVMDVAFRVLPFSEGVLDLSSRGDIASVTARLAGVSVRP